jgi:hypothetical protein
MHNTVAADNQYSTIAAFESKWFSQEPSKAVLLKAFEKPWKPSVLTQIVLINVLDLKNIHLVTLSL